MFQGRVLVFTKQGSFAQMRICKSATRVDLESFPVVSFRGFEVSFLELNRAEKHFGKIILWKQFFHSGKYVACALKILGVAINDPCFYQKCELLVGGSDGPFFCHVQLLSFSGRVSICTN